MGGGVFIELITSDHKLKASRESSKRDRDNGPFSGALYTDRLSGKRSCDTKGFENLYLYFVQPLYNWMTREATCVKQKCLLLGPYKRAVRILL